MASYVTSPFAPSEKDEADRMVPRAADAVENWIRRGIEAAMNETNRSDAME